MRKAKLDRFCLVRGGYVRVGYPTAKIRKGLKRPELRRIRDRAVLALTSSPLHRLRGLRKGSSTRTVRRRLRAERRYRVGPYDWYLAPSNRARIVVKARRGKVIELGVADLRLTRDKKLVGRFVRSFS